MSRAKLTDKHVRDVRPDPTGKRIEIFDTNMPGFGIRVSGKGKKTWYTYYRFDGKLRQVSLGRYPAVSLKAAHTKARDLFQQLAVGIDPHRKSLVGNGTGGDETFGDVADQFMEKYCRPKNRSWKQSERYLDYDILPVLEDQLFHGITRRDIHELIDGIIARGSKSSAKQTFALLRTLFNWAVDREIIGVSPMAGMKPPYTPKPRETVLTQVEICALWNAFCQIGYPIGTVWQLQLLTAQRIGEVCGMRWAELDLENKVWCIPAERTKAGRAHEVPLSDTAVTIIRGLNHFHDCDLVFPGRDLKKPVTGLDYAKKRAARISGAYHWRPHDLRRTAATKLAELGTPRLVIGCILNHAESGVTKLYDRYAYKAEKQQALDDWATELARIIGQPQGDNTGNVIPLPRLAKAS